MKKIFFALVMMLTTAVSASAMSYEQARNEALFLTDKMAYELNLTDAQYEAAYEINLDYLMGVTSVNDVFGIYWERRNLDLSYILYSWQWDAFIAASYFYRPLYWEAGYWHFGIYARYPHRDYFFFGRPHFYATYRGAHAWHLHGTHGYYHGRTSHFRPSLPQGRSHFGMRNGYDRGDYRNSRAGSSTRVTGQRGGHYDNNRGGNGNYNRGGNGNYNRGGNGDYNRGGSNNRGGDYNRGNNGNYNRGGSNNQERSNSGHFGRDNSSNRSGGSANRGGNATRSGAAGNHSGSHSGGNNNGGGHFGRAHR